MSPDLFSAILCNKTALKSKRSEKINVDKKVAKRLIENVVYPLIALGIVLAVWAIWAKAKDNPLVLPMPSAVLARFFALGGEKGFGQASAQRFCARSFAL